MSDSFTSDMFDSRGMEFERHTASHRANARGTSENEDESLYGVSPQRFDSEPAIAAEEASKENVLAAPRTSTSESDTPIEGRNLDQADDRVDIIVKDWTDSIPTFSKFTGATELEADNYLSQTNGNLQKAVELFMTYKLSKPQHDPSEALSDESGLKPETLLDEALAAARPKRLQRDGDVVVLLDIDDLSKTYRLRSEDCARASPIFRHELATGLNTHLSIHGIKHLFILQRPAKEGAMPLLGQRPVNTMRADCQNDFYKQPVTKSGVGHNEDYAKQIKLEENEAEAGVSGRSQHDSNKVDWVSAYETFIRVLAFPRIIPGISHTDISAALEKIELVAQIAKATQAVSSISVAVNNTFLTFVESQQLWSAIAKDAARWILVGINLQNLLIYNEAFIHVAGCYPEWPWSVPQKDVPYAVLESIATKSLVLDQMRKDIERKLICQTLTKQETLPGKSKGKTSQPTYASHQFNPIHFSILSVFRDWVAIHLKHLDSGEKGHPKTKTAICDHLGEACLTVAGFHRLIAKGGDAYMPVENLLKEYWDDESFPLGDDDADTIRSALKTLKTWAAGLVAPLLVSRLRFEGKDELGYLTAVDIGEEDVPWDVKKSKCEGSDEDDGDEF